MDGNSQGDFAREFYIIKQGDTPVLVRRSDKSEVVRERDAVQAAVSKMMPAMAYRPYWRAFDSKNGNFWNTESIREASNAYFYPRQEIIMELRVVAFQRMQLLVQGEGKGEMVRFAKEFEQLRWAPGRKSIWKRVNSLDQEGTEGKGVLKTNTSVMGARWSRVFLVRPFGEKVPFSCRTVNIERGSDTAVGCSRVFKYSEPQRETGASSVDIIPANKELQ